MEIPYFLFIHPSFMNNPGVSEKANKVGKPLLNLFKEERKTQIHKIRDNKGKK